MSLCLLQADVTVQSHTFLTSALETISFSSFIGSCLGFGAGVHVLAEREFWSTGDDHARIRVSQLFTDLRYVAVCLNIQSSKPQNKFPYLGKNLVLVNTSYLCSVPTAVSLCKLSII